MALCSSKFEKFVLIFFYGTDLSIITLSLIQSLPRKCLIPVGKSITINPNISHSWNKSPHFPQWVCYWYCTSITWKPIQNIFFLPPNWLQVERCGEQTSDEIICGYSPITRPDMNNQRSVLSWGWTCCSCD